MGGPIPKPAATRQRRNRHSTAAELPAEAPLRGRPRLPVDRAWRAETRHWWRDVWRSPMAGEYLRSDVHGLLVLARLVDDFWSDPSVKLAAEIRAQGQGYGLTPIDRRRLQWEVARGEAAERKRGRPLPAAAVDTDPAADPRRVLQVVS